MDFGGKKFATKLQPLWWAMQVSGIEILKFGEGLSGAVCEFLQGERQIPPRAAVANGYVLLGAQFDEAFNIKTDTVEMRAWLGPSIKSIEIGNNKGLTKLKAFGQPL